MRDHSGFVITDNKASIYHHDRWLIIHANLIGNPNAASGMGRMRRSGRSPKGDFFIRRGTKDFAELLEPWKEIVAGQTGSVGSYAEMGESQGMAWNAECSP